MNALNIEAAILLLTVPPTRLINAADMLNLRAIDRWENEGGEIPLITKPLSAETRTDA